MKPTTVSIDSLRDPASNHLVFQKIPKKSIFSPPSDSPLYECELIKKGKITKNKRFFVFYSNRCLFFQDKSQKVLKGICFFDFDLRLEWLYHSSKDKVFDKLYGIKFLRQSDTCELQANEDILKNLIPLLNRKLNLLNFHTHYKAIKKIGKGNFASVYLVEKADSGVSYAVKAFSKECVYSQDKGKESLINEIEIMRALDHINVIKLHEVYETDNSLYMVLELLKGGNLVDYLKSHGKFNEKEAATFLRAIIKGICHCHERGVMHRDLKPENILFRTNEMSEENICIADFGLATFLEVDEYLFSRCGTPGFVAPEVVNLKDTKVKYNPICDEFSVGIIFHILVFGKSIFPGKTYNDILAQNRACVFDFNDSLYEKLSPPAKDIMMRLLETKFEKRMSSKEALDHEYLSINKKKIYDESPVNLKKLSLDNHVPSSPLYSPLKKNSQDYNSSFMNASEDKSDALVSRQPCLNGYTNTIDKIGSQMNNSANLDDSPEKIKKISIVKQSKFSDVQSPGLKHALSNSNGNVVNEKDKKQKLSIFQEKYRTGSMADKANEEERKGEK